MVLISFWVTIKGQVDKDRLIETGSSDGVHHSESFIKEFISSDDCHGDFVAELLLSSLVDYLGLF